MKKTGREEKCELSSGCADNYSINDKDTDSCYMPEIIFLK